MKDSGMGTKQVLKVALSASVVVSKPTKREYQGNHYGTVVGIWEINAENKLVLPIHGLIHTRRWKERERYI